MAKRFVETSRGFISVDHITSINTKDGGEFIIYLASQEHPYSVTKEEPNGLMQVRKILEESVDSYYPPRPE